MAVKDVPSPSAEIAISKPQLDASIKGPLTCANIEAVLGNADATLFSTHRATKTRANIGIGILPAAATARRANNQPTTSTKHKNNNKKKKKKKKKETQQE